MGTTTMATSSEPPVDRHQPSAAADPKLWGHAPGPHEEGCSKTPTGLGGAVCGLVHERCSAHVKLTGLPCGRWPKGAAVSCLSHGGGAKQVVGAAARRLALGQAQVEVDAERGRRLQLGGVLPVDTAEALSELVAEAAFNVAVYRHMVRRLDADTGAPTVGLGSTLFVRTGSTAKANEAEAHVWLAAYNDERDRLARYSKLATDAGVKERQIRVLEDQARMLADAFGVFAVEMGSGAVDVVGDPHDRVRLAAFMGDWGPAAARALAAVRVEAIDTTETGDRL